MITLNNEAVKAVNATNYARAIELLERALEWSPHYKTALINQGSIIECEAALKLKDDPMVRAKLDAAITNLKKSGRR